MAGPKQMYDFQGKKVEGESVPFKNNSEDWTVYTLDDGSTLKTKNVMMDVIRLKEYQENGDPVYITVSQQILAVMANPSLKKKAN